MTTSRRIRPHDPPPETDRLIVVMGDIEMGAGGPADDFPHSDWLGELICSYNEPPFDRIAVDLVFNGDTFDLHKTSYLGAFTHHITGEVALGKMATIAGAHPGFFQGLRSFLDYEGAERRAFFVVGNHDPELLFPDVQLFIQTKLGRFAGVGFPGFELEIGRVHIEHGSQLDPMFTMQPDMPFVEYRGERVLNLSWGSVAILDTVLQLQHLLAFHERLLPRTAVFEMMPEVKELITSAFWRYWTRDYWKGYFSHPDPTKKLSWPMVKDLVVRLSTKNIDVSMDRRLHERLKRDDRIRLYVVGHQHRPTQWSHGDRKILQAGCLRNEYMVVDAGETIRPMPKGYVEAYCRQGTPIRSHHVEIEAPEAPPGYIPDSIFDVLPEVRRLLAPHQARAEREARRRLEQAEKG